MQYISWQEWHRNWKDNKSLNEITSDYNYFLYQYESYEQYEASIRRLGSETQFLLQENRQYILQENGDKIIWLINQ